MIYMTLCVDLAEIPLFCLLNWTVYNMMEDIWRHIWVFRDWLDVTSIIIMNLFTIYSTYVGF
jgi:hypothetical protein